MADRTGLEPATSGVTGRHSNQLNYRSALKRDNEATDAGQIRGPHYLVMRPRRVIKLVVGGTGIEPVTLAL